MQKKNEECNGTEHCLKVGGSVALERRELMYKAGSLSESKIRKRNTKPVRFHLCYSISCHKHCLPVVS